MYCHSCGNKLADTSAICLKCGVPTPSHWTPDLGTDFTMRMLLPVGRSANSIAAGYLGLVSYLMLPMIIALFFIEQPGMHMVSEHLWVFSLLMVPAPLAFLFGLMAVMEIKRNPQKLGIVRAIFGIVSGALFTAVGITTAVVLFLSFIN
jgi:hypothetical protein